MYKHLVANVRWDDTGVEEFPSRYSVYLVD